MTSTPKLDIHPVYTLILLYLEPVLALGGAYLGHFRPQEFLNTFVPGLASPNGPASYQVIFNQQAAMLVLFAFNLAVVLRVTSDLRVWRTMLFGMLLCDFMHVGASWSVLGPMMLDVGAWRKEEWANLGFLGVVIVVRMCFLAGLGVREGGRAQGKKKRT